MWVTFCILSETQRFLCAYFKKNLNHKILFITSFVIHFISKCVHSKVKTSHMKKDKESKRNYTKLSIENILTLLLFTSFKVNFYHILSFLLMYNFLVIFPSLQEYAKHALHNTQTFYRSTQTTCSGCHCQPS